MIANVAIYQLVEGSFPQFNSLRPHHQWLLHLICIDRTEVDGVQYKRDGVRRKEAEVMGLNVD